VLPRGHGRVARRLVGLSFEYGDTVPPSTDRLLDTVDVDKTRVHRLSIRAAPDVP
jgi:hypothetical protein